MRIDVISDVVCPWCYIGKRRLTQALTLYAAGNPNAEVQVVWRPFQLNPQLPVEGMARSEYVHRKFGSRAEGIYDRVDRVGRSVGIDFAFDRIVRQPNTVRAHQLIALAQQYERQNDMVEVLFRGYFIEGADLTQTDDLVALAIRAGLEEKAVRACLADDAQRQATLSEDEEARALGVSGVPFFIFERRLAVSGAQDAEVLLRAIRESAAEPVHQD